MLALSIVLGIVIMGAFYYSLVVSTGEDNFKGINLQLDGFYTNNKKMTLAAYEELKKQGKNCEITKLSNSFSEIIVESEKYFVSARVGGIKGGIIQTIQLRPIKK